MPIFCMKKLFVLLVLILLPAVLPAQEKTRTLPRQQVTMLVSEFSGARGFDVVRDYFSRK